ncbi:hypothetical protein GCM10008997_32190 [Halomonas salifodinae]
MRAESYSFIWQPWVLMKSFFAIRIRVAARGPTFPSPVWGLYRRGLAAKREYLGKDYTHPPGWEPESPVPSLGLFWRQAFAGRCEPLPGRYRCPASLSHPAPLAGPVLAIHGQPVRSRAPHPWHRTPAPPCLQRPLAISAAFLREGGACPGFGPGAAVIFLPVTVRRALLPTGEAVK